MSDNIKFSTHVPVISDPIRTDPVGKAPTVKKKSNKRLGAMFMAQASMVMSYIGVPDNEKPRVTESRKLISNHKVGKLLQTFIDKLLLGKDSKSLPDTIAALHMVLGEIATIKYGGTAEQKAGPYIEAYFNNAAREKLLQVNQRLDVLAGADSLFETMNETNRQDVKGVMAVMKRAVMQELARQGIGEPLRMLAGRLAEPELNAVAITKAWFSLVDGVYAAYNEGLPTVPYLQAGLEGLPPSATRVLSAVLAPNVPPHARQARYLLEHIIHETPRDTPAAAVFDCLDTGTVHDAVRAHILSYLDIEIADCARKLENAARPDVRTAEIGNGVWREIRQTLKNIGWVYLNGAPNNSDDRAWEDEALDAETERQFIRALEQIQRRSAQDVLMRADPERLIAIYAHRDNWSHEQRQRLGVMLVNARDNRLTLMRDEVEAARSDVNAVLAENRRVATAQRLVLLGDALATYDRFALLTEAPQTLDNDAAINETITAAVQTLRVAGEPAGPLGYLSVQDLDDAAFADLRHVAEGLASHGVLLDPISAQAEVLRRMERLSLDAALQTGLEEFSNLLRGPELAPLPFCAMVSAVAHADVARREALAAFGDRSVDLRGTAASPELIRGLIEVLSWDNDKAPVQWRETRHYVEGLLSQLRQIKAAMETDGDAWASYGVSYAVVNTSISILQTIKRHHDASIAA